VAIEHAALRGLAQADVELARAQARQREAGELIRELGVLYHPYALETGQTQTVAHVAARFASVWERLRALAEPPTCRTAPANVSPRPSA